MTQNTASEQRTGWRITSSLSGGLIGDFVWALALLGVMLGELIEKYDFFLREVIGLLQLICGLFALPIALGGWLFIWGDNGPPYDWIDSAAVQVGFGLGFYAIVGAVIGFAVARKRRWQLSARMMMVAISTIALAIGIAVSSPF